MQWLTACVLGACGGAIVEFIEVWGDLAEWRQARQAAWHRHGGSRLPSPADFVDVSKHGLLLASRLILGVTAGAIFHAQVTGSVAAIAVGATAPALLEQLGRGRVIGGGDQSSGRADGAGTGKLPLPDIPHATTAGGEKEG